MSTEAVVFDSSKSSPLQCGAIIKNAYFPDNLRELHEICSNLGKKEAVVLGGISNCLILEEIDNAIIMSRFKGITEKNGLLEVAAGENLSRFIHYINIMGYGGLENLAGVPGTVGGAVFGNSGCYGTVISDVIESVKVYNRKERKAVCYKKNEIGFFERHTTFVRDIDILLEVHMQLQKTLPELLSKQSDMVIEKRKEQQPKKPSLGSVFRKYKGQSAGYYIEKAGLKGFRYGGMQISEKHANFIINVDKGTAYDYYKLMVLAEKEVWEKFGIKLEREVSIIGIWQNL